MREDFFEETAYIIDQKKERNKYITFNVISKFFYVVFVILLIIDIFNFNFEVFSQGILLIIVSILLNLLPVVFCFLVGFFLGKFRKKYYNEFDYTFVSGSFRFSKVVMNKRRYPIVKFDASQIDKIGFYGSPLCEEYFNNKNIKKEILTANKETAEDKKIFYMLVTISGIRTLYILECTEKFISNVLHFVKPTVWEREYKK